MRLQQIRSLTEDIRFYYKRLRNNKDELEPRRKSKVAPPPTEQHQRATRVLIDTNSFSFLHLFQVANIYFDASLQCGDHCYVGLPFVLKCKFFFRSVCKQGCTESQYVLWKQLLRFLSEEIESPTLFLSDKYNYFVNLSDSAMHTGISETCEQKKVCCSSSDYGASVLQFHILKPQLRCFTSPIDWCIFDFIMSLI